MRFERKKGDGKGLQVEIPSCEDRAWLFRILLGTKVQLRGWGLRRNSEVVSWGCSKKLVGG